MKPEASHRHHQGRKKAPVQGLGCSQEKGYQWSPKWAGLLNSFGNSRRNLDQVHSFLELQATSHENGGQACMAWREREWNCLLMKDPLKQESSSSKDGRILCKLVFFFPPPSFWKFFRNMKKHHHLLPSSSVFCTFSVTFDTCANEFE